MPSTTNFGWTTPADTDLVKDGAAAIRTLGNGIDTSLVDLKGGTTGQVLAKATGTDLDFTWTTPSTSPLTTKGDLYTRSTVDARLGVGANGTVLTADSAEATGLKWATPSAPSFVGAFVYTSNSAQEMQNGVWTTVTYSNEHYDTNGFHDNSTNNSRLTIPSGQGGYYLVISRVNFDNISSIEAMQFRVLKNGTDQIQKSLYTTPGSSYYDNSMDMAFVWSLTAGDYIEFQGISGTGSGALIVAGNQFGFGLTKLGA